MLQNQFLHETFKYAYSHKGAIAVAGSLLCILLLVSAKNVMGGELCHN